MQSCSIAKPGLGVAVHNMCNSPGRCRALLSESPAMQTLLKTCLAVASVWEMALFAAIALALLGTVAMVS